MPEGPELHLMGVVVNDAARGRLFRAVRVSEVTRAAGKNPLVEVPAHWTRDGELRFRVSASTRGKELQLALRPPDDSSDEKIVLLLHCGMTGHVVFVPSGEEHDKHAHVSQVDSVRVAHWLILRAQLILEREDGAALTFVDPRRFGRWEQTNGAWGEGRSPCALTEFEAFRAHVLASVELPVFARTPICELLLDQQFFNGVGNYLRGKNACALAPLPAAGLWQRRVSDGI
jgi:endonuclease VIII-like 1